jgi:lysozyme
MNRAISKSGLALLRKFEGFYAAPVQLSKRRWMVGHGHVRVGAAGEPVTKTEADTLLRLDAAAIAVTVNAALQTRLTQSQFDALVSFALSIGPAAFVKSQVLRKVNARDFVAAATAMDAWRKSRTSGALSDALVLRRAAEKALFLKDAPNAIAPSVIVRAALDQPPRSAAKRKPAARPALAPAQVLTKILQSEPATEALLLTRVAPPEPIDMADEITTAHAAPVARKVHRTRFTLPRLRLALGRENFGLVALLLFGGALIALGATLLIGGDNVDMVAGSALATPGFAAAFMSGYGLLQAPKLRRVAF